MSVMHKINQVVESFIGLEKRRSDLVDKPGYFTELKNARIRPSGGLSKRRGWHIVAESGTTESQNSDISSDTSPDPIMGLSTWKGKNSSNEDIKEVIAFKRNPRKFQMYRVTWINLGPLGGSKEPIVVSFLPNADGDFIFSVLKTSTGVTETFNVGNGKGTGSVSDKTIHELYQFLVGDVGGLSGGYRLTMLTESGMSTGAVKAAHMIPFSATVLSDGAAPDDRVDTEAVRMTAIDRGDSSYNYCAGAYTEYSTGAQDFTNVSTAMVNDVMYCCTGHDELFKYDGSKIYRAGLPKPGVLGPVNSIQFADNGQQNPVDTSDTPIGIAGRPSSGSKKYYYVAVYSHTDAQGNLISSNVSDIFSFHTSTPNSQNTYITVTIPGLPAGTGFDLNNVKIDLYRAKNADSDASGDNVPDSATQFFKVTTGTKEATVKVGHEPNDDTAANYNNDSTSADFRKINNNQLTNIGNSIDYLDWTPDIDLGSTFVTTQDYSEGRHDLPPKTKYITTHQGSLVLANTTTNGNEVFHSLAQFNIESGEIGTEYFPNDSNSVIVSASNGGPITGLKTLKENIYVFHENNVSVLSGELDVSISDSFLRQDLITAQGEIGSTTSQGIQEYEGSLTFLSDEGIMTVNNSAPYPKELSQAIKPLLLDKDINRKLATSFFTADEDVMGFFLPTMDTTTSATDVFTKPLENVVYVYDTKTKGWLKWTNIDMSGGVVRCDGRTYFVSRNSNRIDIKTFKESGTESDYSDHESAIDMEITTAWDSLTSAAMFKKYIRLKVFVTDTNEKFEGNEFTLKLYLRKDFNNYDIGPIEISSSAFGGYGKGKWGIFNWGDRLFEGVKTKLFGKAKSIQLKFTNNNLNENILLSGYSMEIAAPFKPEIKE